VNEHPEILLAEYADGTLTPEAEAEVEAHLAECAACREELALATEARAALGTLPEVPAPEGLTFAVRHRARRPGTPRLSRLVGAAAAAVLLASGVLVVIAVTGGNEARVAQRDRGSAQAPAPAAEGQGGAEGGAQEAPDEAAATDEASMLAAPAVPTYSESNRDYDGGDLVKIGRRVRDRARAVLDGGLARSATAFYGNFDPAAFTPEVREAIECSLAEVPPDQLLVPFSIEAASFEGQPAYVAAFLQGPAPDQPYDRVVVWVVARDSCSLRSLATQRL
jgi:anti-sigma factor RsiW